jgi:sugar phosphate isomerase/epimerase
MGNPGSFEVAKELGFEGVEVSYQPDGNFSLAKSENRKLFLEAAEKNGVAISSLAMGVLNNRPLATISEAEMWVEDCIAALTEMNLKKVLLAFFGDGDIKDKTDSRKIVVEKLKRLAPKAEKQGKTLGIESYLNAAEHLEMLQSIGNSAVKIYYDEQNMLTKGYPIYDDLELLLKEKAVCQIHLKESKTRLGEGKVDFKRIRHLLEKYDYRGWVVAESSVRGDWKESQSANAAFMKKTFQ